MLISQVGNLNLTWNLTWSGCITDFLPARRYASAGHCDSNVSVCPSVCLSVCLSVTR